MHTSKYDTFSSQELGLLHWTQELLARWVGYGSGVRVNASYRCTVCVTVYFSIHRNGVTVNAEIVVIAVCTNPSFYDGVEPRRTYWRSNRRSVSMVNHVASLCAAAGNAFFGCVNCPVVTYVIYGQDNGAQPGLEKTWVF